MEKIDKIKKMSFNEAYDYLQSKGIGNWDNVNSEEIIKQYCSEMSLKGICISHILKVIEENPSKEELYSIWLGNSMETPTPINNVNDLLDALEINETNLKEYDVIIDLGSKTFRVKAENDKEAKEKAMFEFEALSCEDKIEEYWIGDIEEVQE